MIVIKLWGGMCNQMFQYAFGFALAKEHGDSLAFDTEFYNSQPTNMGKRKVEITKFSLSSFSVVTRPREVAFYENKYVNYLVRKFPRFFVPTSANAYFFKEKLHEFYADVPYAEGKKNYYDGYWLASKYFSAYRDELIAEFTPEEQVKNIVKARMKEASTENSVAIHIRRGDYLNPGALPHGITYDGLMRYYVRAIEYMKNHIEKPIFYVFSDDIAWCEEALTQYIPDMRIPVAPAAEGAIVDLFSIASCKHGIMSPSTFSWWGNWLRQEQNGTVVVPAGNYANRFFAESNWIQIEA